MRTFRIMMGLPFIVFGVLCLLFGLFSCDVFLIVLGLIFGWVFVQLGLLIVGKKKQVDTLPEFLDFVPPVDDANSWRNDPATDRQKSFADDLGIEYPRNISKGDLSDMISAVTGR